MEKYRIAIRLFTSLPSRERGLKYILILQMPTFLPVAPLAGAWIEIYETGAKTPSLDVAPLAGAWIEMVVELAWT